MKSVVLVCVFLAGCTLEKSDTKVTPTPTGAIIYNPQKGVIIISDNKVQTAIADPWSKGSEDNPYVIKNASEAYGLPDGAFYSFNGKVRKYDKGIFKDHYIEGGLYTDSVLAFLYTIRNDKRRFDSIADTILGEWLEGTDTNIINMIYSADNDKRVHYNRLYVANRARIEKARKSK